MSESTSQKTSPASVYQAYASNHLVLTPQAITGEVVAADEVGAVAAGVTDGPEMVVSNTSGRSFT